jgi:hypothetical protein
MCATRTGTSCARFIGQSNRRHPDGKRKSGFFVYFESRKSMQGYANVAVRAVSKLRSGDPISAREAWDRAAAEVFPDSASMQSKGCPRTTFLCASGVVSGVTARDAMRDSTNARHARECLKLLAQYPNYISMPPRKLWDVVTNNSGKTYNQQMHVILSLAQGGYLAIE